MKIIDIFFSLNVHVTFYLSLKDALYKCTIIHSQRGRGGGAFQYACWKFWRKSLRDTEILFCGHGLNFVHPLEVSVLKQTLSQVIVSWLNALNDTTKKLWTCWGRNTLRGNKTAFLTPKK